MTRIGKIARLPHAIRDDLNRRLLNGIPGKDLVAWLDGLPEVQAILAAQFDARPITPSNLTDWKQGGYEDWRRERAANDWLSPLADQATALSLESGQAPVSDALSPVVAVALGHRIQRIALSDEEITPRSVKKVVTLARAVAELRRTDHRQQKAHLALESLRSLYPPEPVG